MDNNKILHDLKRISLAMKLLQEEIDKLYDDFKNGEKEGGK